MSLSTEPRIGAVRARAYRIPTDRPEADGTLEWRATTLVLAEIEAGPVTGLGYSYTDASAARLVAGTLGEAMHGQVLSDHPAMLAGMWRAVRNLGRAGLAATAISALDIALWDARAKWLDLPLARLLGRARERVEIYGSGGFTSYDLATLSTQLEGWRREGIRACKIKIGARDANDMTRLRTARDALGPEGELFVDANGAYAPRVALGFAEAAAAFDLRWFEEPVSSEDLDGLRGVREGVAGRCEIAAGEYAWLPDDFRRLLASGAIDVLQADATRCGGISGFLAAAALAEAHHRDLSAHCAPALHRHVAGALARVRHIEWFHDHARIEQMLFDGAPVPLDGRVAADDGAPGLGLALKARDAEAYAL
ncbi:enolase C-terminal domain-like protein [Burkholderia gladioli]|uniref:Mandelate racemase n=1 Tax=Burkholderia gladioli TaxID=28095 RepID=A0A2A7SI99_BURGA|nr:enolase C-terminal domain-like protein [Burkholderia gladioli]MBU9194180.1 mandelate racemase [Burkholderia gladioli]MBU9421405.1 mandelate racemase [Burkholderia gladioli]MDN7921667.1 enolase C-terminal domain-like protein [Burkholderia gladioli]MDN8058131.1 enolase C-terminal domain-like protein [Burkholderia gladioli]PEH43000.1 mandelate racemase [Burkholderia gladioli]